jgi:glycosyltransferase involved in cell wall biosynthesis
MRVSVLTPSIRPEGLKVTQDGLAAQTFTDFEWLVEIGIPKRGHDLNAAYNRMLRRAKGDIIVSLQDYIRVPPDYLQKFQSAFDEHTFVTAPVGKVDNLDFKGPAKWDWRAYEDAKPSWQHWEIDSGMAPRAALFEIGGFDEELDQHWSCDNVNVGYRAHLAGYTFANLFSNPAVAYDHDAFIKHPFRAKFKPSFNNERLSAFDHGLKLNYLL